MRAGPPAGEPTTPHNERRLRAAVLVEAVGPVATAVAIGVNALLAGLLFIVPRPRPVLTIAGNISFKPEWDSILYLGAAALSMALVPVLLLLRDRDTGWPAPLSRGATQVIAAALVTAVALSAFLRGRAPMLDGDRPDGKYALVFLAGVLLLLVTALLGRSGPAPARARPPERQRMPRLNAVDVFFPAAVVAAVLAPAWGQLAGITYQLDAMLHWDYFAMGPATAFARGVALGTEFRPFYGVGWPMFFVALSPVYELSYTHMIAVNVVVTCLYLVGAYAFLRLLLRSTAWACAGVTLVLVLHFFARSAAPFSPYWGFPSLGVLRWSFDVWLFITLILFQRSNRARWAVAGGAILGLAVVFETDTGLLLGGAWACFWAASLFVSSEARRLVRVLVASAGTAAAVLFTGLLVASRGTLLQKAFWSGWLANLRETSSGFSLEPITTGVGRRVVIAFVAMTVTYLLVVGRTLVLTLRRRATPTDVVVGALAVYGYVVLLYFVGRSTPYTLVRATIPFALLLAVLGARTVHLAYPRRPALTRTVGWASALVAAAVLVANPVFRNYERQLALPGHLAGTAVPDTDVCLLERPRDLCGLPATLVPAQANVARIADRLRALAPGDATVAVLDQTGPMFHLASGTRPWGRYSPYLLLVARRAQVDAILADFRRAPPDVVVFRAGEQPLFVDLLAELRAVTVAQFVLDSEIGGFEIWRRRAA